MQWQRAGSAAPRRSAAATGPPFAAATRHSGRWQLAGAPTRAGGAAQESAPALTGAVVDAGDGCTSCTPVVEGYVLSSALRSLPLAGRDVTRYMQKLLRCDRPCERTCWTPWREGRRSRAPPQCSPAVHARTAGVCAKRSPAPCNRCYSKHRWTARITVCNRSQVPLLDMVAGRHAARLTAPGACRERRAPVPPDQWLDVARRIKEAHCYVCSDVAKANTRLLMRLRHLLLPCGYPECVLCVSVAGTAALSSAGCGRVWTLAEPSQRPTNADDTPCLPCLLPLTC